MKIGEIKGNRESLEKLMECHRKETLVPFIGAGFSMDIYPGWGAFVEDFFNSVELTYMEEEEITAFEELNGSNDENRYEAMAELLVNCTESLGFKRAIIETFDKDITQDIRSKFRLLNETFPRLKVTTNFDCLIENNFEHHMEVVRGNRSEDLKDLLNPELKSTLVKIHGCVTKISTLVLTQLQYNMQYGYNGSIDEQKPLPAFLNSLFNSRHILFVGCSFKSDRWLKLLERRQEIPEHFALLKRKTDDVAQKRFARHLSRHMITPIWIDSYSQIVDIIELLSPNYIASEKINQQATFVGHTEFRRELESLIKGKSQSKEQINHIREPAVSEINILHLSDLHLKKNKDGGGKIFRKDVQEKMLNAIKGHLDERQGLDFVAVTGDIAFSGKKQEYDEAEKFFERLKVIVPANSKFLLVPGNHDVDRRKVNKFLSLQQNVVNGENVEEFLREKKNISGILNPKFRAFRKFSDVLSPELYDNSTDMFWVKDFAEKNLSFVGLNSSWASEGDLDQTRLALGYSQVKAAFEKATEKNRILLMHHPLFNWFAEQDFRSCFGEIINNCSLILHGHEHFDNATCISTPSDSCVCLGTNSCYTRQSKSHIGFQFLKVSYNSDGMDVVVCPYKMDFREKVQFFPDTMRWEGQNGLPYFELSTKRTYISSNEQEKNLSIPNDYREWMEDFHSTLPIGQLAKKAEAVKVVPLPRVYIPLETSNPFHNEETKRLQVEKEKKRRTEGEDGSDDDLEPKEPSVIDIEALLGRQDTVLLRGEPGMGKTTLVRHLAYMVVHGQSKPGLQGYLPVLVFLKDLWPLFEKDITDGNDGKKFEEMLGPYFDQIECPLGVDVVKDYMKQDRAILLIDGLDEVPDHLRGPLVEKIARFWSKNKKNRFLLTGRPHGINGQVMDRFGKFLQDIEPLDQEKIAGFITDWFREVCEKAKGIAKKTAVELIGDISTNEYVSVFVRNPLLLTAVCILYQDNTKKLPDQRADLYGRVVDNLLYKRFLDLSDPDSVPRLEEFLMRLAFDMQEKHSKHMDPLEVHMDPLEVKKILMKIYHKNDDESHSKYNRRIDHLFDEIEPNCGLLKRHSGGEVEFFHLTFQEFMAARHMIDLELNYKEYLSDSWWDETILLYVGLISLHSRKESNRIVREILESSGENKSQHHRLSLLGSKALRDMLSSKRSPEVVELSRQYLKGVITSHEDPKIRLEAGEILGVFEDDRYTDFEMVEVPAGEFIRGSKKGEFHDDEAPSRRIYLDTYLIGKYPVTNREFKEFVESGGYTREEFWLPEGLDFLKAEKISEPLYWRDRKLNGLNFPVVGVSWYECEAFCRWLSDKTGINYRFPTEAEWEKAARGTDGRLWPWGNEFVKKACNSFDLQLMRTSPIGIFPGGESPHGCMDMAGNVWEWCYDWYEGGYYKDSPMKNPLGPKNGESRVMRGGGWFHDGGHCQCAYRHIDHPAGRGDALGFRLARSL